MKRYLGDQAKGSVPHTQDKPTGECADSWNGSDFCKLAPKCKFMWVEKCVRCPVEDGSM